MLDKTVVVTNIQGIESSFERDPQFAEAMISRHRNLIDSQKENYDFQIYDYKENNTILVFNNALDAIECSKDLQRQFVEFPKIPVRLGIDYGDVTLDDKDDFGKATYTAYKIAKSAQPGSVIISAKVNDQLAEDEDVDAQFIEVFEWDSDVRDVKMFAVSDDKLIVPEPDEIKARVKPLSEIGSKGKSSINHVIISIGTLLVASAIFAYLNVLNSDPLIDNYSIAVLPFENLGSDEESQIISHGFSNDILNKLSLIEDLTIISSLSSMQYDSELSNNKEIAKELGVAFLLKGTFHRFGKDLRIKAQLLDIASADVVWSNTYNRSYSEIMNIESEIAKDVVDALRLKLSFDDMQNVVGTPTGSVEAYDLFLEANVEASKRTTSDNKRSIQLYSNAIRIDTAFSRAYTGIAKSVLNRIKLENIDITEVINLAELYLERAKDINENNGEIYVLQGMIYNLTNQMEKAKLSLEKAYDLMPNDVLTHLQMADYFYVTHQHKRQMLFNKKAYQLDPFNSDAALSYVSALITNRKFEEAEILLKKIEARTDDDELEEINKQRANLYILQKNYQRAISPLVKLSNNGKPFLGTLAFSYGKLGETAKAYEVIDSIKLQRDITKKNYDLAVAFAGLKEKDSTIKYLDSIGLVKSQKQDSVYRYFEIFKEDKNFLKTVNAKKN